MIFKARDKNSKNVKVYDAQGNLIGSCFEYNTKTNEVKMFLIGYQIGTGKTRILMKRLASKPGSRKWGILKIKIKIPGSYAEVNGNKYVDKQKKGK